MLLCYLLNAFIFNKHTPKKYLPVLIISYYWQRGKSNTQQQRVCPFSQLHDQTIELSAKMTRYIHINTDIRCYT